jgi:hypothetical protein
MKKMMTSGALALLLAGNGRHVFPAGKKFFLEMPII